MTNTMWGGRFAASPAEIMEEINASIDFDKRLWRHDIQASKAHVAMLGATGILTKKEASAIARGLDKIMAEIEAGTFTFSRALEDIHLNVENRLRELIGPVAGKLHTARSRNDQVATDFKLYVRDEIGTIDAALGALQLALARKALAHAGAVMPGFTHLQTAQPITFGHHCLAYVEMLGRDRGRFADAAERLSECPLGAAALAGTSFPIDREMTAKALDFERPAANSLDAVSDRDFALETLSACSIAAMHLSRLAEEIVLWTSPQFALARLSDKFTDRLIDHAAEAEPRRRRAGARQDGQDRRRVPGPAHGDEGPPAGLCQGHAGGQGAGVRRARFAQARRRCHDRHGRGPRA